MIYVCIRESGEGWNLQDVQQDGAECLLLARTQMRHHPWDLTHAAMSYIKYL